MTVTLGLAIAALVFLGIAVLACIAGVRLIKQLDYLTEGLDEARSLRRHWQDVAADRSTRLSTAVALMREHERVDAPNDHMERWNKFLDGMEVSQRQTTMAGSINVVWPDVGWVNEADDGR